MSDQEFEIRNQWEAIRLSKGYVKMEFQMPIEQIKIWLAKENGSKFSLLINKLQGFLK